MGLLFTALIGVNVYFFLLRGGTSLRALLHTSELGKQVGPQAAIVPHPGEEPPSGGTVATPRVRPADGDDDGRVVEGVMNPGDTVERRFRADGLSARDAHALAAALGRGLDPKLVRPGQRYSLHFDAEGHLRALDYIASGALAYHVEREGGTFRESEEKKPIETKVVELGGTVSGSLYEAIKRSGESTALVSRLVDLFAWDVNFFTDTQPGDTFKVIVEKRMLGGRFYQYGHILAAEYRGRSGAVRAFWFQPEGAGEGGYFTEHGESVVKTLLKTPLKYVRVSSAFDRHRFHPILHTERAHLGVDYAAPAGTPVWATADGKVRFVGPRGGAGNAIVLEHANGMESTYMHLSRFARGLAVGQTVRQKQVIGYVGMTGLATGPHLHFSLKVNGAFVDPLKVKPERAAPLPERYRVQFADQVAPRLTELAAIDTRTPVHVTLRGPSPMP